jgi:hypothetical protein
MDTILGAGFAEFPGGEGGWDVPVEWEPPPQPDKTSREPKAETPSKRSREMRSTNPSKKTFVQECAGSIARLLPSGDLHLRAVSDLLKRFSL